MLLARSGVRTENAWLSGPIELASTSMAPFPSLLANRSGAIAERPAVMLSTSRCWLHSSTVLDTAWGSITTHPIKGTVLPAWIFTLHPLPKGSDIQLGAICRAASHVMLPPPPLPTAQVTHLLNTRTGVSVLPTYQRRLYCRREYSHCPHPPCRRCCAANSQAPFRSRRLYCQREYSHCPHPLQSA